MVRQGISKSLLSQLGIHLLLGKQGKKDSNSLANKLGKNINLAYLLSARANISAPTPVGIVIFAAPPPLLPRSRSVGASSPRAPLLLARLLPARLSFSRVESSVLPQSIDAGRCSLGSQVRFPLYFPVDGCLPLLGPDPAAADQWRLPAAEAARGKKTASAEAAAARDKICRCSLPRRSLLSIFSVLH